jgi:hypothetical protein
MPIESGRRGKGSDHKAGWIRFEIDQRLLQPALNIVGAYLVLRLDSILAASSPVLIC